jgi:GxxExxY protein
MSFRFWRGRRDRFCVSYKSYVMVAFTAENKRSRGGAEIRGNEERERENYLGGIILDACIAVHREPGPGLLESAYTLALATELRLRGLNVKVQVPVELTYKNTLLGKAYVMDLLVENLVILEIKSVEALAPIFEAQIITYLKLAGKHLGYLINFNVPLVKDGFKRIVYNF